MEQAPLLYCHTCKNSKPKDQFKLCEKDDQYGKKGEPTGKCSPCMTRKQQRDQNKKQKHTEEGSDDPVEPGHIISIEEFTASLRQQACMDDISYHAHVSTQGLPEEADEAFNVIAVRVWEATGFRFTYGWYLLEV